MTIASGADIHHDTVSGQGTVGAWLIHPPSGLRFGLSCNHVVAALGHAQVGAPVYQQGRAVGQVHSHIGLSTAHYNRADAALFRVPPEAMLSWAHPPPVGTALPVPGMHVYKVGATTGHTSGRIMDIGRDQHFRLRGVPLWFENIIAIEGHGAPFSDHGDSGALLMEAGTHQAVGVLMAMNEHLSFAFPMQAAGPQLRELRYAV